ncbi:MAG TPA: hypothetical protein VLU25_17120 [Acidobacteriota bacterium]|nr:hypothetical protein [Acidobacteriota bacterium]
MSEFLSEILAFPTVIFSGLLGLCLLYWLTVILGALDLDLFDSLMGLDGAEGALESLEALDAVDAVDAVDAASAADVASAGDAADAADAASGGFLDALGISGVPILISFSFLALFGWMISYLGMQLVDDPAWVLGGTLTAGLVLVSSAGLGTLATILTVRPMRRFFTTPDARTHSSLVGSVCTITTSSVDAEFGQGEIDDSAAGLLVQVRCAEDNEMKRGDKALIFDYDPRKQAFKVVPLEDSLAGEARLGQR